jgi:hypothetical protein
MKNSIARSLVATALAAGLMVTPSLGTAEETAKAWSVDTAVSFYSDYMFRGFNLFNGTSIQPSVYANYETDFGTFTAGAWSHLSADQKSGGDRFTEIDYTLKYSYSWEPVTIAAGYLWYRYPSDDIVETEEFFATLSYDWDLLNPVVNFYHDTDAFDNQYYDLTLSHEFSDVLGSETAITPYVNFGFASDADKVYEDDGLVVVIAGTSVSYDFGPITVSPNFNYSFKVDDNTVNTFFIGTNLSYSF